MIRPIGNGRGTDALGADRRGRRARERRDLQGDLDLRFQPVVRPDDGVVVGLEAIAGHEDPAGFVPSADDLPDFAEAGGLAQRLDHRTLALVAAELKRADVPPDVEWISVNVAPGSLMESEVVMRVAELADELSELDLGLLVEISDGRGHLDPLSAVVELTWLRRSGVRVALDEFGKKPTLVGRLLHFPVDVVKVDGRLPDNGFRRLSNPSQFTMGLVCLARSLGREVILDRLEDPASEEDASLVAEADFVQGPAYGDPVRLDDLA